MTSFQPRAATAIEPVDVSDERHGLAARATASSTAKAAAYRRTHRLTVLVIDPRSLMREGLTRLLESQGSLRILAVASPAEAASLCEEELANVEVIILNIGDADVGDQAVRDDLDALSELPTLPPVVIVSARNDSRHVGEALLLGARGYVPTTCSAQLLVGALFLVQVGGTFVPAEAFATALSQQCRESEMSKFSPGVNNLGGLTPRQLDVLGLLRQGKPNKIIAYELSMRESTVKVHVRAIMRKLKASNRTEVVFRAASMAEGTRA